MKPTIPPEKLAAYDALIASAAEIERRGETSPYTSRNGHMFSYLSKTGTMGLRLDEPEREAFLAKYGTELFVQYGVVMKEFVTVPDDLLQNPEELRPHLLAGYEYIGTLKPKPPAGK